MKSLFILLLLTGCAGSQLDDWKEGTCAVRIDSTYKTPGRVVLRTVDGALIQFNKEPPSYGYRLNATLDREYRVVPCAIMDLNLTEGID